MTLSPCLVCGEPSDGPRCTEHALPKPTAQDKGYDHHWRTLSKRARRLQPFCSDCGSTDDLQADHSPQAWQRHAEGLTIRLGDVDVVCGPCNRARGAARTLGGGPIQRAALEIGRAHV